MILLGNFGGIVFPDCSFCENLGLSAVLEGSSEGRPRRCRGPGSLARDRRGDLFRRDRPAGAGGAARPVARAS